MNGECPSAPWESEESARFPGENHEMSRSGKPKYRMERLRLIVRWMAKHLQAPS